MDALDHGVAEEALRVFLHASICERIVLELDDSLVLADDALVIDCLLLELEALKDEWNVSAFEDLNRIVVQIMRGVCSHALEPYLIALEDGADMSAPVLALPTHPPEMENCYASSCELAGPEGTGFLVILSLCPAAPSEIVGI